MKIENMSMTNQIMLAMVLGMIAGLLFTDNIVPIQIIGDIFLRLIQMSIIILVMGQIMEAVGNINPSKLGRVGVKTIAIFGISSLLASYYGIIMAILFKPGQGLNTHIFETEGAVATDHFSSFSDLILDFFPTNIMNALSQGSIVQVVVFSLIFGVALSQFNQENTSNPLLKMIVQFNEVILKVVNIVMRLAPLGIFAIIAATIGQMGIQVVIPLGKYLAVYAIGTFTFLFFWFVIASIYSGFSMIKLIQKLMSVSMMALATTSSVVTFPTALKTTETDLGVNNRIAKFVIPLGTSINRNGAAMFMAITVVTIAQMYQITYSQQEYLFIAILVTLISLAGAGVPGAGVISLAIVVPQIGLPIESIALFAGIEWFTGMLRTVLNVDADIFTALMVAKSEEQLDYKISNKRI